MLQYIDDLARFLLIFLEESKAWNNTQFVCMLYRLFIFDGCYKNCKRKKNLSKSHTAIEMYVVLVKNLSRNNTVCGHFEYT